MKIAYFELLEKVFESNQPQKIKVGTATYTWNGCDYILNTDSRKSLSDTLTSWTIKAQTTAEFIEVVENVLTKDEKEYLSAVIKPFRNKIESIGKYCIDRFNSDNYEYICIFFTDEDECMLFPNFKADTMYKGMEKTKKYTLEELGL